MKEALRQLLRDTRSQKLRTFLTIFGIIWGTTSVSLVALSPGGLRYDFTAVPGDMSAWRPVSVN